jgi:hypothetical protein
MYKSLIILLLITPGFINNNGLLLFALGVDNSEITHGSADRSNTTVYNSVAGQKLKFPVEFPFFETENAVEVEKFNNLTQNNQAEPYQKADFKVSGTPNITVKSVNGSIQVLPGDSRTVRVELYVTRRGLTVLGTDRLGDDFRIVMRQRNDQITAEIISLKGGSWSTNTPIFNFVVYAPINSNASISTNNGDITVTDIRGNIDVRSSSGDISLVNTRGASRLSSTSGNVRVNSHSGAVFTNALAGDVRINDVTGECRIRVISGNVTLDDIKGSTIVHATNGNIELNTSRIDVLIDLETIVGNIRTTIPANGALNLNIQGQRVNINAARNFVGDIQRNSINGKLNGGGVPVRIKSAVGSVDIRLQQ